MVMMFYVFIYYQNYTYDDLNRLTGASGMVTEGKSNAGNVFDSYVMQMDYNQMSSPVHYDLTFVNTGGSRNTNYDYLYDDKIQPNAPIKVGDMRYTYDASGNPISIDGSTVGRAMSYDAENRLREITDYRKNIMSQYSYNHTGERAVKRYGAFETMAVNGAPAGSKLDGNAKYSAYVSPYYVEHGSGTKPGAVSKHYYAGAVKIASKTADSAYFYFADHLGSTTHLTDRGGKVVQYAAYTPYGSLFREYRSVQPYKFNGKELDQETGYYYYGARYYDPSTTLWLGTDPLKHKYPDIGAYVYCAGNPIKYVDPDGRELLNFLNQDDEGDQRISNAMKVYDNNSPVIHLVAHGNKSEIRIFIDKKAQKLTTGDALSLLLSANSEYWQDNMGESTFTVVVLHSCQTGKNDEEVVPIAQEISKHKDFKNTLIIAPSEHVEVETKKGKSNEKGVFDKDSKKKGVWNMYYKGTKVLTFDGSSKPIFKDLKKLEQRIIERYEETTKNN